MSTRVNRMRENIDNMKIAVAIGHGAHASSQPIVQIPDNVYVIFMTKPGYLGHLQNTTGESFSRIFSSENKVKQLVRGNLPRAEMPSIVIQKDWNWTQHMYSPGMMVHNHILELFDNGTNANRVRYNDIAGLHILGTRIKSWGKGETKTLQQLMEKVSQDAGKKRAVLFISGCRGDVNYSKQLTNEALKINSRTGRAYLIGKQNYNITRTKLIHNIQNTENQVARYTRLKRIRNTNGSPPKRARVTVNNATNMNINSTNTNRFKNFLNRVVNLQERKVPLNSLKNVYKSNFNTYNRARRAIGNLTDKFMMNNASNQNKINHLKSKGYSNVEIQLALKYA